VVATLNPGLSMRTFDDSVVVAPRAQTSSPAIGLPRAGTHSGMTEMPGLWSGPAMSTGQNPLMSTAQNQLMARQSNEVSGGSYPGQSMPLRAQSSPSIVPSSQSLSDPHLMAALSSQPVQLRRSGLAVFGWLVLAALLFGGVGALLYMSLGERSAATKASGAVLGEPGSNVEPQIAPAPLPPPAPPTKQRPKQAPAAAPTEGSAAPGAAPQAALPIDVQPDVQPDAVTGSGGSPPEKKPTEDKAHKRPATRQAANKRTALANDDKEPKTASALVKQARAFERDGHWSEARAVYQRLEKAKGYSLGEARYRQAFAAFQSNATDEAVQLAADAARQPGPFKVPAMFLYGDALFRLHEYERAKSIYANLRKTVSGDDRALAAKKIAACNKVLKLPATNGIVD
jgi:hypothetical protein